MVPFLVGEKNMNDPFYKTKRWEHLRASILKRDGYICQESKRYGRIVQANTVHHIFPREDFPEYQWQPWNLISLSNEQHEAMHYRSGKELTEKGVDLVKRTARKQGLDLDKILGEKRKAKQNQ